MSLSARHTVAVHKGYAAPERHSRWGYRSPRSPSKVCDVETNVSSTAVFFTGITAADSTSRLMANAAKVFGDNFRIVKHYSDSL